MSHYKSHPSGIEAIEITQYESFLRGNILKYVLRAPYKGTELEDLEKAAEYLQWEIERVKEDEFWAKFEERDKIEKDFVHTGNKVAKHLEEIGKMRNEWDEAKRDEYGTYYLGAGFFSNKAFDQVVFPDKCQECEGDCKVC